MPKIVKYTMRLNGDRGNKGIRSPPTNGPIGPAPQNTFNPLINTDIVSSNQP